MRLASTIISLVMFFFLLVGDVARGSEAADIFERRIRPIAASTKSSSCVECHFAGVDLKQYILNDAAQTFAALRAAGLVNIERPRESKLLTFIQRKPEKEDRLLAKVREEELAAFQTWIEAAAKDPAILKTAAPKQVVGSPAPLEVVRHARLDRVLQSFIENIWVDMERCENCHSPEKNAKQAKQYGNRVSWLSPRDPAGTLAQAIQQGIIDPDHPNDSPILTKPLALVEHGGHRKFATGGDSDRRFRKFLNDYAAIVNGKYRTAADLPEPTRDLRFATGQQLKITDLPEAWRDCLLRVDLYRWEGNGWSKERVATGDSYVNGMQKVWQNLVFGVELRSEAATASALKKRLLPDGKYQVRLYLDRDKKTPDNRDFVLGENEFVGSVDIDGAWKPGYQPPKIVSWLKKN